MTDNNTPAADPQALDPDALTAAHLAVEDALIEFRDSNMFMLAANGFVVRNRDGSSSDIMRMGTRMGLDIAIRAYLHHLSTNPTTTTEAPRD